MTRKAADLEGGARARTDFDEGAGGTRRRLRAFLSALACCAPCLLACQCCALRCCPRLCGAKSNDRGDQRAIRDEDGGGVERDVNRASLDAPISKLVSRIGCGCLLLHRRGRRHVLIDAPLLPQKAENGGQYVNKACRAQKSEGA